MPGVRPDAIEFRDRTDAGERLARVLRPTLGPDALLLALPRGGVVVGAAIAEALRCPLDALVVRKIGHPSDPEYGVGAVVEEFPPVLDADQLIRAGLTEEDLAPTIRLEQQEVERRVRRYRAGEPLPEVRGRTVVLVDDGIATGGTMRAAIRALRARRPHRVIVAVGVAPAEVVARQRSTADEFHCLDVPAEFGSVGASYRDFSAVSDDAVVALLRRHRAPSRPAEGSAPRPSAGL